MNTLYRKCRSLTFFIFISAGFVQSAQAHGYISSPTGRTFLCNKVVNSGCGAVQYEPQSVEGPKGFPEKGPQDGALASGGNSRFPELNQQTPSRWSKVTLHSGKVNFTWTLTALHKSTGWKYFITKQGWDSSKPLSRISFDLKPFCQVDGGNNVPTSPLTHSCSIPSNRSGYHVILAAWDIADTSYAFYQVIDANILH